MPDYNKDAAGSDPLSAKAGSFIDAQRGVSTKQETETVDQKADTDDGQPDALSLFRQKLRDEGVVITDKSWVPYEGPSGGTGWRNTDTGDIDYSDSPPGGTPEGIPDSLDELEAAIESGDITEEDLASLSEEGEEPDEDQVDEAQAEDDGPEGDFDSMSPEDKIDALEINDEVQYPDGSTATVVDKDDDGVRLDADGYEFTIKPGDKDTEDITMAGGDNDDSGPNPIDRSHVDEAAQAAGVDYETADQILRDEGLWNGGSPQDTLDAYEKHLDEDQFSTLMSELTNDPDRVDVDEAAEAAGVDFETADQILLDEGLWDGGSAQDTLAAYRKHIDEDQFDTILSELNSNDGGDGGPYGVGTDDPAEARELLADQHSAEELESMLADEIGEDSVPSSMSGNEEQLAKGIVEARGRESRGDDPVGDEGDDGGSEWDDANEVRSELTSQGVDPMIAGEVGFAVANTDNPTESTVIDAIETMRPGSPDNQFEADNITAMLDLERDAGQKAESLPDSLNAKAADFIDKQR